MGKRDYLSRPLAFLDLESTGLDVDIHEIVDVGCILTTQDTLNVIAELDARVKPEHIETADPVALKVNGYNEEDWKDALTLEEATHLLHAMTDGAIVCAHNIANIDWPMTLKAFKRFGLEDNTDYHRIDLFTYGYEMLRYDGIKYFGLNYMADYLGLGKEPDPHRAINGARKGLEVYGVLRERYRRMHAYTPASKYRDPKT